VEVKRLLLERRNRGKVGEKRKFTNTALLPQFAARKGKVGFAN